MSFTITNNSANAVISAIDTQSSTYGSFTVTSGSFPIAYGESVSGTNTDINDLKGSPEGTILLFLLKGNAQIDYTLNGNLISGFDYSSGWCQISSPIISAGDTIALTIVDATNPYPSPTPTPSTTAAVTPTPTGTPASTPQPTTTPTPSSTPVAVPILSGTSHFYSANDSTTISGITGTISMNGVQLTNKVVNNAKDVSFTEANVIVKYTSATTIHPDITITATADTGYHFADDGNGVWDKQVLSGFTYTSGAWEPDQTRWTGTTAFFTGSTQIPYTEAGTIIQQNNFDRIDISGVFETNYFNVLPD